MNINDIYRICSSGDIFIGWNTDIEINRASSLEKADECSVTWVSEKKKDKVLLIEKCKAAVIICDKSMALGYLQNDKQFIIQTDNPRLLFIRILNEFFKEKRAPGIHPTAVIHPSATISDDVYIGPHAVIGNCIIWSGCIIEAHCVIHDHVRIGKDVNIHSGTVIGSDGFGYSRNEAGEMEKFPQSGGVIIGSNVEIGSNTCIDRGTLDDTIIEEGCKIDNLVHIAHNVHVKKNSVIIAHAMIGGSTVIEEGSWIAPSVALMNGITIGKGATIGLGAVVTKSVPEKEVWVGNPGHNIKNKIS